MKKPHELRQLAAKVRARADEIYSRYKEDDAPEFPDTELKQYDALIDESSKLIDQAEAFERRESRLNELDRRAQSKAPTRTDGVAEDADDFEEEVTTRKYSILRAFQLRAEGRAIDGWEGEVSEEIARRSGKRPQGFYFPLGLPFDGHAARRASRANGFHHRGDLTTTTGVGAVPVVTPPNTLIELLRAKSGLILAGAQVFSDLTGSFSVPRQTGAASWQWVTEGNAPTTSNQSIDAVVLSPRTGAARTLITRRMLNQASFDVEMFVRSDLISVAAIGIDTAGVAGPAGGTSPLGLLNNASVPVAASLGTNGGPLTLAALIALETAVTASNVDVNRAAYLTNSKVVGHAKQQPKIGSTFPIFLMGDDKSMNGYGTNVTNIVPSNLTKAAGINLSALLFGDWSQLLIGMWGVLDILNDPYSAGNSGGLNVYALQDLDIAPRHPEAFSKLVDIAA